MPAMPRAPIAVVLALAFAGAPLVLDHCATTCEAAHAGSATDTTPTCHHATTPTARIAAIPTPCGHDHSSTVTTITADAGQVVQPQKSVMAVTASSVAMNLGPTSGFEDAAASPPTRPSAHQLAVPLRI